MVPGILSSLLSATLLVLPVLLAVLLVAILFKRQRHPTNAYRVGQTLTAALAGFAVIGCVSSMLFYLLSPTVQVEVPVEEYWPTLPGVEYQYNGSAQRVEGGFTQADLTLSGLSFGVRALLSLSQGLVWLIMAILAAYIAVAFAQVRRGEPFAQILIRLTTVAALVVGLGGFIGVISGGIGASWAAAEALNGVSGTSSANLPDLNLLDIVPRPGVSFTLPLWPIGAVLGFGAISVILRRGQALTEDSKGLI